MDLNNGIQALKISMKCIFKLPQGPWKLLQNCSQRILCVTLNFIWVKYKDKKH